MLNQSFRQVFVANTSVLLPSGSTADLAVGQIAIADGNTYAPTSSPTYGTNKAITIWQGMPDVSHLPLMAGIPQTNQSSKLIKGKLLTKFRRKTATEGQNQKVAVGFDGVDTEKNLFAKCGEVRTVYIKATGNPIDKLYSNQGFMRQYRLDTGCCEDCGGDSCADVDPLALANSLAEKINTDPKWNAGGGQLFRAKVVKSSVLDTTDANECTVYTISVADDGSFEALTAVQVQTPYAVTRIERDGIFSTYQITVCDGGSVGPLSNAGIFTTPDCGVCPVGYTSEAEGFLYKLVRADAGTAGALTTVETDYSLAADGEGAVRISFDTVNNISVYLITSNSDAVVAIGVDDTIEALGSVDGKCVLTTPTLSAWTEGDTVYQFPKTYKITVADDVCGDSRLTDIEAAYPDLEITETGEGDCVHSFETEVFSEPVDPTCGVENLVFVAPTAFEGLSWEEVASTPETDIQAGVVIETAFVNRITGDCTFDYYPYEADTIHIQVSEWNHDYNGSPCEDRWPITPLQEVKYPTGVGAYVREQEKKSLSYFLKERSVDPAVREAEGFVFVTDPYKSYDEYTLEFDFKYKVLGWSETYTDSYHLVVYFPTGKGTAFETAILTYVDSIGNDVDVDFD